MGRYKALAPVFDAETGKTHMPGHYFDMDDARAVALVPDFAEPVRRAKAVTKAELLAEAEAAGIEVPDKATKADIEKLLGAAGEPEAGE